MNPMGSRDLVDTISSDINSPLIRLSSPFGGESKFFRNFGPKKRLWRCVHNKDDHNKDNYNEDDHTGFHFQFSPWGRGTQGGDSVQRVGGGA